MDARKLVDWLAEVEELALNVYKDAAKTMPPAYSHVLQQLSEDEQSHLQMINSVKNNLDKLGSTPNSALKVDDETCSGIMTPLRLIQSELINNSLTVDTMVKAIAEVELGEWNDLFVYLVTLCQQQLGMLQNVAHAASEHESHLEALFQIDPSISKEIERNQRPGNLWKQSVLIVEDESIIRDIWTRVLSRFARVETARDGKEALEKVRQSYFDAIITDIDMPVMDGMEFFQQSLKIDKTASNRFVFCTGDLREEVLEFADAHSVPVLAKPFNISDMTKITETIFNRTNPPA